VRRAALLAAALLVVAAASAAAFEPADVEAAAALAREVEADVLWLADDAREGRHPGSAGWLATQEYLIDQLEPIAEGLVPGLTGRAAFLQHFLDEAQFGDLMLANVVALIPGGDLADEYVVVGGHYDHLPAERCREIGGDDLCNGATDNAAGAAAVLAIARAIAALPAPPRRSIVIALWDAEEYDLIGSQHFVFTDPLVPLAEVSAYVNLDLVGANLAPSVRDTSFALGAESGGALLQQWTAEAIAEVELGIRPLSQVFGQGRSDYAWFLSAQVPIVYFGDSTNACYHSGADEVEIVDFGKLADQSEAAFRLALALAEAEQQPDFVPWTPPHLQLDYYEDLVVLSELLTNALDDLEHFSESRAEELVELEAQARARVALGPDEYQLGWAAATGLAAIDIAQFGLPCDPLLLPEPVAAPLAAAAALGLLRRKRSRR
jgi:hypothetical protein